MSGFTVRRSLLVSGHLGHHTASGCAYLKARFVTNAPLEVNEYDLAIVGGGIVGAATAFRISQIPRSKPLRLVILEKESELAMHQTGRNSGVIHSGIYYKTGTLKAKLCTAGLESMYEYCDKYNVPYKKIGKLIVAVENEELLRLEELFQNGVKNGVRDLQIIEGNRIKDYEPNCRGLKAILSPHTGIVDYKVVTESLVNNVVKSGGEMLLKFEVNKFKCLPEKDCLLIGATDGRSISCKGAIVCGGLQSDRLAVLSNCKPEPKIVAFRGDYLEMKPEKRHLVRGNIYPVPDPRFPFLGVHFTPRMDGGLWLGPTAVFSYAREGYNMTSFNFKDTWDAVSFPGFLRLGGKYIGFGMGEFFRNLYIPAQIKQLQRYVPDISSKDVIRAPSGNRAQALDHKGNLVDDFVIDSPEDELGKKLIHVRNAPSPAATSSLSIADYISRTAQDKFSFLRS